MSVTISNLQTMAQEYQNFINAYNTANVALQNVISVGTVLYNDATFAALFPNSITAYKTYLVSLQTDINSFIAGIPAAPALSG